MSRARHALAFVAGAAAVLAFSPFDGYPVGLASLAVLVQLWLAAPPRACFWSGFWFGLGFFGAGVSWVYVSLSQFGGMAPPLAALATLGFVALLALYPAAAGWLQARVPAPEGARAALLVPASWTLAEWLRGWFLTGMPWLSVGYAAQGWPLEGFAPLAGVYAMSFATVALAGLLRNVALGPARAVPAAIAVALIAAGQGLRAVEWSVPAGAPVSVALLQGNVTPDMKFRPERYFQTLETYARLAEQSGAKLIVLPETAVPSFFDRTDPAYLARLEALARRNRGDLLLGIPYRTAPGKYYNSVMSLGSSPRQLYHKVHLVPFGEFAPPGLRQLVNALTIPLTDFSRGAPGQPPLAVAGQRVAVNISYEDVFGAEIAPAAADAGLLVNVTNVAWFGDSLAPAQDLQMARVRALETARTFLTASNTGITAAIDRDGRVLARLPQFVEGRLELSVQGYTGATPYVRFGDWPILLAALAALATAIVVARAKRSR